MKDILGVLADIRRPRLLLSAAREVAKNGRRSDNLQRLLGPQRGTSTDATLLQLLELEAGLDDMRRKHIGGYSPKRHIEVLAAVLGQAEQLKRAAV
ncbi:DUF6477 family protein [Sagittula sp. SSi028]|uniref:DUF6477 family protein n=1 Tax=Sagittula sp. SSi028 TaxID=3400636 RepID=UPI003AF922FC